MTTVLIVDDDPLVRKMLRLTLSQAGFAVRTAENGKVASQLLEESVSDVVVMDIVMPEKEGLETTVEIRERWPRIKVIAISGGARLGPTGQVRLEASQNLRLANRLGAHRTFSKPIDNDELIQAIRELASENL
ncbi:MAG: response regulator [Candidatus Hydrogenedens sp.]|nr:response regulator [Candidatus Hydrogenedens sp.]